jgi:hypothetical protein
VSLRDQILNSNDIPKELVKVKEWGIEIEVRGMTGAERTRILDIAMGKDQDVNLQMVYPEIVIATAFDAETGEQIFTPADRTALLSKSANALDRLATVGMRLSGFTAETTEAMGKDSSETVSEDSSLS